jgi:hypothetical protein
MEEQAQKLAGFIRIYRETGKPAHRRRSRRQESAAE